MTTRETFDTSWAEWREAQIRGELEGEARLRQTLLARGTRPHLPDGSDFLDLDAVERVHQDPGETASIPELSPT